MEWVNENSKKSDVYIAKSNQIRLSVVMGHINYPNDWILNAVPDIFKGTHRLGSLDEMTPEQACKNAEEVTALRLKSMLRDVSA
jgi:hypothetical protein